MTGYRVSASRTIPVDVEHAFDVVLTEPLPRLFSRRYGPIAPIREVRDQTGGAWGTVGQTRRIVLADGGAMTERLTEVARPASFGYVISDLKGPFKALISSLEGEWSFEAAGTGTRVTWSWTLHPVSSMGSYAMPVFARLWRGYARQALEEVEKVLV